MGQKTADRKQAQDMNTEFNSSADQVGYLAAELCRYQDYNTIAIPGVQYFVLEGKGDYCWHMSDSCLLALATPKVWNRRGRSP